MKQSADTFEFLHLQDIARYLTLSRILIQRCRSRSCWQTDSQGDRKEDRQRDEPKIPKTWFPWKPAEFFLWLKLFWTHLHKPPKSLMSLRSLTRCLHMHLCVCVQSTRWRSHMNLNATDKSYSQFVFYWDKKKSTLKHKILITVLYAFIVIVILQCVCFVHLLNDYTHY